MLDVFIVTGASKGIGFELFRQLKEVGKTVVGIARTNPSNETRFFTADLTKIDQLPNLITSIVEDYRIHASRFTLINNAGMVEPIGKVGTLQIEQIQHAMTLNTTAPIVLSNAFINVLADFKGMKRILNISSGAGRKPYPGWGIYCATKAALDHFTRITSLEQQQVQYPVFTTSIAPGIIDTGMQEVIRSSRVEDFPLLEQFQDYKAQGLLSSAEQTASQLITFMERHFDRAVDPILDIRHLSGV